MVTISKDSLNEAAKNLLEMNPEKQNEILFRLLKTQPELKAPLFVMGMVEPALIRGFLLAYWAIEIELEKQEISELNNLLER